MRGSRRGLIAEMIFVLASVMMLKEWVFPFFVWRLFPTGDLAAQMLEWMMIMVGVITCFIYLGLGSSSKYFLHLSGKEGVYVFCLVHLPFPLIEWSGLNAVPGLVWLDSVGQSWSGLIGDGMKLFIPMSWAHSAGWLTLFTLFLFIVGRRLKVEDETTKKQVILIREEESG